MKQAPGSRRALLDATDKSLWIAAGAASGDLEGGGVTSEALAGASLFGGSVAWPAMVMRESALAHNIATFARFCSDHNLEFAPHGKTTLAPELFARQVEAGAWGITVASASQANVAYRGGVKRVIIATEVLDVPALTALGRMLAADPERELYVFVDSPEGVSALGEAARSAAEGGEAPSLGALIDIGWQGGRTGVRDGGQARAIASAIAREPRVHAAGVGCYEGGLPTSERVREYFAEVIEIAERIFGDAAAAGQRPIVTAGGSAYFDLVASEFSDNWARARDYRVVLRSGAYVSHDDGIYVGKTGFLRVPEEGKLMPAIEVWSQVTSTPEPGLAMLAMGRRDAPYDSGMPVPVALRRTGQSAIENLRGEATVSEMDDQHGYLRVSAQRGIRPGDLVACGISHPCTAFDKWRSFVVVDDDYRIIDVVKTYF